MKYIVKAGTNCALTGFAYNSDYSAFGSRRFAWSFLREHNCEFPVRYIYLLLNHEEGDNFSFHHCGNICLFCSDGDYVVKVSSDDTKTITKEIISEDNRASLITSGNNDITVTSTFTSGVMQIVSEFPLEGCEEKSLSFEKANGISIITDVSRSNMIKVYDSQIYCQNGISNNFTWVFDDFFKFKNTFRGMYMQEPPRNSAQILTCIKGAADIYLTDMNEPQKNGSVIRLDTPSKSILVPKNYAVGFHSLKDETLINQIREEYLDAKHTHRLGLQICNRTDELNIDELIMSVLDRAPDSKMSEDNCK